MNIHYLAMRLRNGFIMDLFGIYISNMLNEADVPDQKKMSVKLPALYGGVFHFPQQLPGPAQPACVGVDPQQGVSPGPGNLEIEAPDRDEWAEIIFLRLVLLHA